MCDSRFPALEEFSGFQITVCREPELQDSNHAACRFGHRRVLNEQSLPDQVRPFAAGQFEILIRPHSGGAKQFGFEVVISDQLIDFPESHWPEQRACRDACERL